MSLELKSIKKDMENAVNALHEKFAGIRGSGASTGLLDSLKIKQNDGEVLLKHVGMVSLLDVNSLKVDVWDKSILGEVEKAIRDKLNLNPARMGDSIKVVVPALSEERRMELCKTVHSYSEDIKISIRNIRKKAMDDIKKMKKEGMSEDLEKKNQNDVQKLHDEFIKEIEQLTKIKETDIMGKKN